MTTGPNAIDKLNRMKMTQQTDRLDVVREAIQDVQFIRANFTKQYINRMERELIEDLHKRLWSIEAALSQPAAHPEPDNAKLEEAIYRVKADLDFRNVLYPHIMVLLEHALAKPAVNEIDLKMLDVAIQDIEETHVKPTHPNLRRVIDAARAYLKLSAQKEG